MTPSQQIIDIFNRLGEEFQTSSGALALSQDLVYLENLVSKDSDKITPEEKQTIDDYLGSIKEQMIKLEETMGVVRTQMEGLMSRLSPQKSELEENLSIRLEDAKQILANRLEGAGIVSRLNHRFDLIIENMRQCLGCLSKECNNDTNLTFGDQTKFHLLAQNPSELRSSMADEIVFACPTTYQEGGQELSLVMDRIYGSNSSEILTSNILCLAKKLRQIKQEFPQAKISILISQAAASGCGMNSDLISERLTKLLPKKTKIEPVNDAQVDLPPSASGDHYVEFGGGARVSGARAINGTRIALV